jgi:hypothetical protein
MTCFGDTIKDDRDRAYRIRDELAIWDSRAAHLQRPDPAPQSPSAAARTAAEGDEPGPAGTHGTASDAPVAGPGGDQGTPETSAPGAAWDKPGPADPPAGDGGQPEAVPGAEHDWPASAGNEAGQ